MKFNDFASKYLSQKDLVISQLISEAEENLSSIEDEISSLKNETLKYKQFIKDFSVKTKSSYQDSFDYYCDYSLLTDKYKSLLDKIINLFSKTDESELGTKSIINQVSKIELHAEVLKALQWLINKKILTRNSNYKFIKGEQWEAKKEILN